MRISDWSSDVCSSDLATCGRRHRSSLALTRPRRAYGGAMLPDGTYDVIVVDAEAEGDDGLRLELTLLDGPHKGEVVSLRATGSGVDELDALGTPGTLTDRKSTRLNSSH